MGTIQEREDPERNDVENIERWGTNPGNGFSHDRPQLRRPVLYPTELRPRAGGVLPFHCGAPTVSDMVAPT